jgi:hypothetical protein
MSVVSGTRSLRGSSRGLFGREAERGEVRTWTHAGCSTTHHSPLTAQHCRVGRQPVQVELGSSYRPASVPAGRRDGVRAAERLASGLVRHLRRA